MYTNIRKTESGTALGATVTGFGSGFVPAAFIES